MTELGDKLALRERCEEEGRQARAAGTPQYENPYISVEQHEERAYWADGWWGDEEDGAQAFIPLSQQKKPFGVIGDQRLGNLSNKKKVA